MNYRRMAVYIHLALFPHYFTMNTCCSFLFLVIYPGRVQMNRLSK